MTSTHVRIPADVKTRLDSLLQPGESIGSLINRLIDKYENGETVNDEVNNVVNNNSHPSFGLESLKEEILDTVNNSVNEEMNLVNDNIMEIMRHINRIDDRIHSLEVAIPEIYDQQMDIEGAPGYVPSPAIEEVRIVDEPAEKSERVKITDEMRAILAGKIKAAKATGKIYTDIVALTGVNESALKKICNDTTPAKSLTQKNIDALMTLGDLIS